MSLSAPGGQGRAYVVEGSVRWLVGRLVSTNLGYEEPTVTQADDALDDTLGAGEPSVGSPAPGPVELVCQAFDDAGPAARVFRTAYADKTDVTVEVWGGEYSLVGQQASGANATTVKIDKATNLLTVARKGTGNALIPADFGLSDAQPGSFWQRGQIVEVAGKAYSVQEWQSKTTRLVDLLGTPTSGIVTPATDAERAADWSVASATDVFKVHRYRRIDTVTGRMLTPGDAAASSTGTEVTVRLRPNDLPARTWALKAGP